MSVAPPCLTIDGRRVIVDYVSPPIPIRNFDYCAYFDRGDIGDPQGYGASALEAAEDLRNKVNARRDFYCED